MKQTSHVLPNELRHALAKEGVDENVLDSLHAACAAITPKMRSACHEHASSLHDTHQRAGVIAVKQKVVFMLDYMQTWRGPVAAAHKKVLSSWAKSK